MTKKKIVLLVLSGIILLFMTASMLNFGVAKERIASDFREQCKNIYNSSNNHSYFIEESESKKEEAVKAGYSIAEFILNEVNIYSGADFPCSVAVADREGNFNFAPKNYFMGHMEENGELLKCYISIDEYITEEFTEAFKDFSKGENLNVEQLSIYKEGKNLIPVSATFRGKGKDNTKTFIFSHYPVTHVMTKYAVYYKFNEVQSASYNRKYFHITEEEVKERYNQITEKDWNGGGAFISSEEAVGDNLFIIDGKEYKLFFAAKYNIFLAALFSETFRYLTVSLALMFSITGFILLFICLKLYDKSKMLDESRKTFISAASHELKTPITVIQNRCECIIEKVVPEKHEEYLKSIYDEALRMDSIVTSLLTYNRLSQMTGIKKENCNISELLSNEVNYYRSFAESKNVFIEERINEDVYANCDSALMKMAIDNYLSNAIKYAQGERKVNINLYKKDKGFLFEVTNEAEENSFLNAKEVWEEFSRADTSRRRQGASIGMGLSVCRRIFDLHGYKGYCDYKEGKVTFIIEGR